MRYALNDKYPIETKDQLVKTAEYFNRFLPKFHPKDRVSAAVTLEKRASELSIDLDSGWIINYARAFNSSEVSPDFSYNIDLRKQACCNKKVYEGSSIVDTSTLLDSFKIDVEKTSSMNMVNRLFYFDKMAGIEGSWDRSIADPFMTVYGCRTNTKYDSVKVAGAVTDYELKKIACDTGSVEKIKDCLGLDTAVEFMRNPVNTISTMSSINKEAFLNAIGR